MHYVSLIIEFLRGRPRLVFWAVALAQAALWIAVPAIFYTAPPGDLPILLAIGHEFVLGSYLGPPLAFWLGEIAFRLGGAFGVYVLAQICVVMTYWAVFTLGRAIVGIRHAMLAVLLMVGIAAFTVQSAEFGPALLAAPFWALALLCYWRAVGEDRRGYWFLLGLDLGLLLLSSYLGLILVVLLILFTLATRRGRQSLAHVEPWLSPLLAAIVVFPHVFWLYDARDLVIEAAREGVKPAAEVLLRLAGILVVAHFGLLLLVVLASGYPRKRGEKAPAIDRDAVEPFARVFVYVFALLPAVAALGLAYGSQRLGALQRVTPLIALSGLAAILAAGDRVLLYRERLVSSAWLALLTLPPFLVIAGVIVLPFVSAVEPPFTLPAKAEANFFADTFARRTGKPLPYVTGDPRVAPLVALDAPSRPHLYFAWAAERSPWASAADLRAKGGVIVWIARDNSGAPPPGLKAQFPDMVPEVPRDFSRRVQGFLPLIRLGWAVLRPEAEKP